QFLRFEAQGAQCRSRLQRPAKHRAYEVFIGLNVFELAVNDRKELFGQWRTLQPFFAMKPGYQVLSVLLEEVKREVLFGFEIIKQSALGDAGLLGNLFGGCLVQSFLAEQAKGRPEDPLLGFFLVLFPLAGPWRAGL